MATAGRKAAVRGAEPVEAERIPVGRGRAKRNYPVRRKIEGNSAKAIEDGEGARDAGLGSFTRNARRRRIQLDEVSEAEREGAGGGDGDVGVRDVAPGTAPVLAGARKRKPLGDVIHLRNAASRISQSGRIERTARGCECVTTLADEGGCGREGVLGREQARAECRLQGIGRGPQDLRVIVRLVAGADAEIRRRECVPSRDSGDRERRGGGDCKAGELIARERIRIRMRNTAPTQPGHRADDGDNRILFHVKHFCSPEEC